MELVEVRNDKRWEHDEEKNVTEKEVTREETELGNLAKEFTAWLRHRVPTHVVPFTSPPGDVGSICLELTGECKRYDKLVNEALNSQSSNHAEECLGE